MSIKAYKISEGMLTKLIALATRIDDVTDAWQKSQSVLAAEILSDMMEITIEQCGEDEDEYDEYEDYADEYDYYDEGEYDTSDYDMSTDGYFDDDLDGDDGECTLGRTQ